MIARRAQAYQMLGYASKPVPDYEWNNSTGVPNMIATNWGEGECALGNTGDEVLLYDAGWRLVDAVAYGSGRVAGVVPWPDASSLYNEDSLERYPANRDSDDCSFDFRVRYEPAPGAVRKLLHPSTYRIESACKTQGISNQSSTGIPAAYR